VENSLGIITPDITRSLGLTFPEGVRTLGLITPDITRSLGQESFVLDQPRTFLGVPLTVVLTVAGLSMVGGGLGGYAAARSAKGYSLGALGGLVGSLGGIAVAGYIQKRALEAGGVSAIESRVA
jgi:hypothetical protein